MIKAEKRITLGFIIVLIALAIVSIIGAIICDVNHPYYIAATCAVISFTLYNEDIKKA